MNLKELLQHKNVSQAELARWVGVSRVTVHLWLTGDRKPSHDKLLAICKALNCTMDELLNTRSNIRRLIDNKLDKMTERELRKVLTYLSNEKEV